MKGTTFSELELREQGVAVHWTRCLIWLPLAGTPMSAGRIAGTRVRSGLSHLRYDAVARSALGDTLVYKCRAHQAYLLLPLSVVP